MLLDTHVWLWGAEGETRRVGPRTRNSIERGRLRGALRISSASIFEVVALHVEGRIHLLGPVEAWVRDAVDAGDFGVSDVTLPIAVNAGLIPSSALPDPIDRLLVATACQLDVPLVTRDERILRYARASRQVDVVDAAR